MAVRKRMRTVATTPGSVVIIVKPGNVKQTLEGAAMGTDAVVNEENETHSDDDVVLEEGTRGKALRPGWQRRMRRVLDHMTDCPEGRKTSSFLDTSSVQPANAAEVLDIWSSRWEVLLGETAISALMCLRPSFSMTGHPLRAARGWRELCPSRSKKPSALPARSAIAG